MNDPNLIRFQDSGSGGKPEGDPEEMDLFHYLQVIRRHRRLIAGGILLSVLVAAVVSLLLPREYEAQTSLLPVSRSSSSRFSNLLNSLGSLADLQGFSDSIPEEGPDLLVNVLESRSVALAVVEKEGLADTLAPDETDARQARRTAVERLREDVLSVSDNNRGLVTVSARCDDPALAARIANAAVEALGGFLQENKVTSASRAQAFLETRLVEVGKELEDAEDALKVFCEKNGVISIPEQTRLLFEQIADLSSEVALRRARAEVLDRFGGSQNPETTRLKAEIESLRKEILDLERGISRTEGPMIQSNGFIPLYHVPEKSLQYSRLMRDVRVKQEVFGFLRTESEASRIRASCEDIAFTVLDPAVPPREPVRPKPLLIVSLAAVFSALATFLLASFLEYLARHRESAQGA